MVSQSRSSGVVLGFTTSVKSRPIILAKLEEFIRNKVIKINSVRLSSELKTFIWKNGKAQAMKGYNDDLVLSCAIACWVRNTSLISYQHDEKYQKTMLKSIFSTRKVLHYDNQGTKPNKVNNYIEEKKQKKPYPFAPFFIK